MKTKIFAFLILALFAASEISAAPKAAQPSVQKTKKVAKKTVKKKKARKKRKRLKYVSPPQDELKVEEMPLVLPIPEEITNLIAQGNLEAAIRELRIEPPSSKSLNLLQDAQKIVIFNKKKDVPKFDKHRFYQNIGVAYHNLYMFLKRHDRTNDDFYKKAKKLYAKSGRSSLKSEKAESKLLRATLEANAGKTEKAQKIFSKIDLSRLGENAEGYEYTAAYYAAIGDVEKAIEALDMAYKLNPEQIALWVAISDDFFGIENRPEFQKLISNWKETPARSNQKLQLNLPKSPAPKFD